MELSQPFIRLPYSFDVEQLQSELAQFDDSVWMAHPSRLSGNSAIPLVSLGGQDNDDFSGRMQPTPHLQKCDYMQQVMASFGEVLARSRLMRLAAGAEVTPHVDFNYHWYSRVRIHIPIVTNPEVIFYCGDDKLHMQAGECWIFDSWRKHNVVNSSGLDRVHLVIDTAGSSRFWNTVRAMESIDSPRADARFIEQIQHLNYQPRRSIDLKTERYNVPLVMSPGELEAIAKELILDVRNNPKNDSAIVEEYSQILEALSKDWREAWHLFGFEQEGWRHYQQLLQGTMQKLRPEPRALVTASNDVGINPIIVQRILRAALNVEQAEAYLAS